MTSKLFLIVFSTLVIICTNCNCARILGLFNVPSKSHHILGSSLLRGLAEKGHEVTMISPYPFKEKIKNYRDIFVEEMLQFKEDNFRSVMKPNSSLLQNPFTLFGIFANMSDIVLSHEGVQKLKTENFDLIIQFAMFTDSFLGLAYHFNAPVILFSTMGSTPMTDKVLGNVSPPAYLAMSASGDLTFFQRVGNVLGLSLAYVFALPIMESYQDKVLHKHFPEAPSLQELQEKIALVFINSHYSIESPRPYIPNMIQVGGIHVAEPKELPPDLQIFLDKATNGAVFFSLGSNVKISTLPAGKVEAILKVLGELNMKVLFKTEKNFEKLPSNIKTGNWLPQNDILAHKNVKLFISHGGYLSTIEAVYHAVPIIGIPIFGDQHRNIIEAAYKGYALEVDLDKLSEESFSRDITEILNNSSYRENIQLRSSLMRGQSSKPLETAIFWVEHVLKYKGADHLKNGGAKLYLYQYLLLDVIAFILAVFLLVIFVIRFVFKKIVSLMKTISKKIKFKKE